MKPLTFPTQIDYYLNAVSCRYSLVEKLKEVLNSYKDSSILDCSVGTGFGIIDLILNNYNITCSDACGDMLERFTTNAQREGVLSSPLQIKWNELGNKLPSLFDIVLCRGNSIVYSNMWENESSSSNFTEIEHSIKGIYNALKIGGSLYIDIPSDKYLDLKVPLTINHESKSVNCLPVKVKEVITCDAQKKKRRWDVSISIAGDHYEFTRYSHLIKENEFRKILIKAGFTHVEKLEKCKYREHYCEFMAYK